MLNSLPDYSQMAKEAMIALNQMRTNPSAYITDCELMLSRF